MRSKNKQTIMFNLLKRFPFFPIVFVINAVWNFYLINYFETTFKEALPTLVLTMIITCLIWVISKKIIGNWDKSAIFVFITSALFLSFQGIVGVFSNTFSLFSNDQFSYQFWASSNGQIIVFFFILILTFLFTILLVKTKSINPVMIQLLNITSIFLVIISSYKGIRDVRLIREIYGNENKIFREYWETQLTDQNAYLLDKGKNPDIYYVILDGFARSDVLQDLYDLDNSEFITSLENRGFYIATASYSNYSQTKISLASSLNMRYLDNVSYMLNVNGSNPFPAIEMIKNNLVVKSLINSGYQTVNVRSSVSFSNFPDWDKYYSPKFKSNGFANAFINSTVMSVFFNSQIFNWHRDSINYTFAALPLTATLEGSQFIFAHILSPHPPFVFLRDGTNNETDRLFSYFDADAFLKTGTQADYKEGYSEQVLYIQQMILNTFDKVNRISDDPFIFIIQADHGPGMYENQNNLEKTDIKERLAILNAIYIEGGNYEAFYPEISPVNTFRVIFSEYSTQDIPLLPDYHYFSSYVKPFDFINVASLLID